MRLNDLLDYTGQLLQIDRFRDYCPNGLQVQGRGEVATIVSGVSACMALLQAAEARGADMILVHHGYFWRNEDARVIGIKRERIRFLLAHDISLAGYHLPLDAHPQFGNNAQLARLLGLTVEGRFGEQDIACYGSLPQARPLGEFAGNVGRALARDPLVIGDEAMPVRRIGWCTGAAQDCLAHAVALGLDAFITGEVSEHTVHLAREAGVAFIAAGHHATERYGVQALGEHLAQQFGLTHHFVDVYNPV